MFMLYAVIIQKTIFDKVIIFYVHNFFLYCTLLMILAHIMCAFPGMIDYSYTGTVKAEFQ